MAKLLTQDESKSRTDDLIERVEKSSAKKKRKWDKEEKNEFTDEDLDVEKVDEQENDRKVLDDIEQYGSDGPPQPPMKKPSRNAHWLAHRTWNVMNMPRLLYKGRDFNNMTKEKGKLGGRKKKSRRKKSRRKKSRRKKSRRKKSRRKRKSKKKRRKTRRRRI
jgi:hypothetical protein